MRIKSSAWSRSVAVVFNVTIGIILLINFAKAEWDVGQISVGDGKGGSTTYPAQKQKFKAPGYAYVMPFGLAQMDDGRIIFTATLETETKHTPVVCYSSDAGNTWTAFEPIPPVTNRPTMLTYLGGTKLTLFGTGYFSDDCGKTWRVEGPVDEHYAANEGNAAVDRDAQGKATRVMATGYSFDAPSTWPIGGDGGFQTSFRYSEDGGHTWKGEIKPSTWSFEDTYEGKTYKLGSGECALVRAANGWLVAALRTDPSARFVATKIANDNLCGTAVSISKDNGQSWSPLKRLYDGGRHHADLRLLPNGDLVMTMIVRDDMKFGGDVISDRRGEDALISRDNGETWNLDHPITIDQFDHPSRSIAPDTAATCGHIATTVLKDGTVLTAYGNYKDASAIMTKWDPSVIKFK